MFWECFITLQVEKLKDRKARSIENTEKQISGNFLINFMILDNGYLSYFSV